MRAIFSICTSFIESVDLTRQKIDYLGCENTPYDVLLDEYEVGVTLELRTLAV